jgi:hypothetical protein
MRERTCFPASSFRDSKAPHYAILGPCACIGCGTPVYWAHSQTRDGWDGPVIKGLLKWREAGGRIHKCLAAKVA